MRNILIYVAVFLTSFHLGISHERDAQLSKAVEAERKALSAELSKYKEHYRRAYTKFNSLKEKEVAYEKIKHLPVVQHECFSPDIVREINETIKK